MALNYGIKIAKSGYDVADATDDQLAFTSKLNAQKIQPTLQGSITESISASSLENIQINHNLGYVPAFEAWYKDDLGNWHSCFTTYILDGLSWNIFTSSGFNNYATSSILNIEVDNSDAGSAHDVTIYYIIFLNSL